MYDLFYRSMDLSDPVLAQLAIEKASKYQSFHFIPVEIRNLLIIDTAGDTAGEQHEGVIDDTHENSFQAALDACVEEDASVDGN